MTDHSIISSPRIWVEVILPLALPASYTYEVPVHLASLVKTGCRVEVIFGKTRKYAAIVKAVIETAPAYPTKPIINVLDNEPLVYPTQLKLWSWMAAYYMCTDGEVMNAALPAHFKLSSETILVYNEDAGENFSDLNDEEFIVAEALLVKKQLRAEEVQQLLETRRVYPVIKTLLDKGFCFAWEKMNDRYVAKKEKYVHITEAYRKEEKLAELLNDWKGAPKQLELLLAYLHLEKSEGQVLQQEVKGKNAKAIMAFNQFIKNRSDIDKVVLTIRDGLYLIRKL